MSLLTTATGRNRDVDTALIVTYAVRRIRGAWTVTRLSVSTTYDTAFLYSRAARKSYRYRGLTEGAAARLAQALADYYTRSVKVSEFDTTEGSATFGDFHDVNGGNVPMADVAAVAEQGGAWAVVVNVNEYDERIRLSGGLTPSTLFTSENARDYDTDQSFDLSNTNT